MTAKILFVLSEGRTGSTLLCQLLSKYKNIIEMAEGLHSIGDNLFRSLIVEEGVVPDLSNKHADFGRYLHKKYGDGIISNEELQKKLLEDPVNVISEITSYFTETIVLKIQLNQLNILEHLNWILSQPNHKFILLERRNYLDVYVSDQIGLQTNRWHMNDTSNVKIKIDLADFIKNLDWYKLKYNDIKLALKNNSIDYLKLEYNKDLKNYNFEEFTTTIKPWLNKHGIDLQINESGKVIVIRQNNNKSVFDNISNLEELLDMIKTKNLDINLVDN
jgi:hypothetical protein